MNTDFIVAHDARILIFLILQRLLDQERVAILKCDGSHIHQIFHSCLIQFELLSSLLNKFNCSIFVVVSCDIPQLSSRHKPFVVLFLEICKSVAFKDLSHLFVFKSHIYHDVLEESECLLIGLLIVEILPIGQELLFHLNEDLLKNGFLRRILHFQKSVYALVDVCWHGVVETCPLEVDVVVHRGHVERKIGAVCHVVEFSQVLVLYLGPEVHEYPRLRSFAQITVLSIDLHAHDRFRPSKFIILLVPKIRVIPLLDEIRLLRKLLVFLEQVEIGGDQIVLWWQVKLLSAKLNVGILHLVQQLCREFLVRISGAIPVLLLVGLGSQRFGTQHDIDF